MRVFSFHLMPYPGLPPDYDGPAWVTCPNELLRPRARRAALQPLHRRAPLGRRARIRRGVRQRASPECLRDYAFTESDRVDPRPSDHEVRIAVVGNALPLYDPPTAGGRGIRNDRLHKRRAPHRGDGRRRWPRVLLVLDQPGSRRESGSLKLTTLIIKAWTEPGPFEFIGKHYKLRYTNTWPRPIQKPHPEIWIPGAGSLETLEFVARHHYAYMGIPYFHIDVFDRMFGCCGKLASAKVTRQIRANWAGWSLSSSPTLMQKPASVTRSTSGTSSVGCCLASTSRLLATRRSNPWRT